MDYILKSLSRQIANEIMQLFSTCPELINVVQEIRIKASKPIILKNRDSDIVLNHITTSDEILHILERFCENSIYAYKNQICEGFLTIKGGHRIGITGTCVIEYGKIINIKYISSLNIRVAREVIGCSNSIINEILDLENKTILNTLLVSPPGKGKTTMLRDLVRQISNGITEYNFNGKIIGLVDERGEIAACYKGVPQKDVGIRTDVIENISKKKGIEILLRSMSPDIIACDEIGTQEDIQAIEKMLISGVKGIFTMHARNIEDVKNNININKLVEKNQIEKIIFL